MVDENTLINAMSQQEKEKIEELARNMTNAEMLVVLSVIPVSIMIDVLKERIESDQRKLGAARDALI